MQSKKLPSVINTRQKKPHSPFPGLHGFCINSFESVKLGNSLNHNGFKHYRLQRLVL